MYDHERWQIFTAKSMDHFPRHVPAAPPAALRARAGAAALAPGGAAGAPAAALPSQAAEGREDSRRHRSPAET